jgi:AAA domain (dynein-related subfamily)
MIQGIALQATRVRAGDTDSAAAYARQVIIVPAAKMMWTRTIADHAPKKTWRKRPVWAYDLASPWSHSPLDVAMTTDWDLRSSAEWHITGDPSGFQMTDDEYLELARGTMPRNVALRYQRALEATGQVIIGTKATHRPTHYRGIGLPNLSALAGTTTGDRLTLELSRLARAVTDHNMTALNLITPRESRARGAGAHRNEHDLPGVTTPVVGGSEPEVPAPAPQSEAVSFDPAPVAPASPRKAASGAVKPGDRVIAADGQVYVARKVESDEKDLSDVELFRRAHADDMNVLLLGEPGTGKTRALAAAWGDAIVFGVTGDTEVSDLVGSWVPTGADSFVWVDGALVTCMLEGRMLILDEISSARTRLAGRSRPRTASASRGPATPMPRVCTWPSPCSRGSRSP